MVTNTLSVVRYHDFSCAHRSVGDPGKCAQIHGHNYRVFFHCQAKVGGGLSPLGRVVDFSIIKQTLCQWLEDTWDHKLLLWERDPIMLEFLSGKVIEITSAWERVLTASIESTTFNTSTELMANFLLDLGNRLLPSHVRLVKVVIEETRKCGAVAEME